MISYHTIGNCNAASDLSIFFSTKDEFIQTDMMQDAGLTSQWQSSRQLRT